MAETLNIISTVSYILAGLFLVISVFLWIKFKIPVIIGDLTGRTAKKSIALMRENNEKTGKKIYRANKINKKEIINSEMETGLLDENTAKDIKNIIIGEDTVLLNSDTTELLDDNATTVLNDNLMMQKNETVKNIDFKIIEEVILIHTDEII